VLILSRNNVSTPRYMIFNETSPLCTALEIIVHIVAPIRRRYENETNKLAAQKTSVLLFALKFG